MSNPIRLIPIFCENSSIAVETLSITFLFTTDYRIFERNQIPINTEKSEKYEVTSVQQNMATFPPFETL